MIKEQEQIKIEHDCNGPINAHSDAMDSKADLLKETIKTAKEFEDQQA
jgi:hypothetical protein